ncbi:type II toxin-antitoxin system VapC family toxin [Patescibacteria group bacterium]|nr:type II toxin-antitoxin system VapC family toxin [Patescibacteria group bacterium]
MLVDTNLFIDFLKGNPKAKDFFQNKTELVTSVLVVMEIIAGLPKKRDIPKLEKFLESAEVKIMPVTQEISDQAYMLYGKYFHKSRLGIPDAFIAATALVLGQDLATLNIKHFKDIKEISTIRPY